MKRELLRKLPKVDYLLNHENLKEYRNKTDYYTFSISVKEGITFFREKILNESIADFSEKEIIEKIKNIIEKNSLYSLRKVVNGTGIIIHTNLGRSIFSKETGKHLFDIATSYNNLEYNLETGKRGSRNFHLEKLICDVTGAESAIVVNNNAAAVVLCLNEFANGKEAVVSRGELVEIGGSFRIPEIMKLAGAKLVEVGTTNRTYSEDYMNAINENTQVIMKVHTSNYKIKGFTHETEIYEIGEIGKARELISIVDLGSGVLIDFQKYKIKREITVHEALNSGVDLVTFSGDKLLGGCQAGIIAGRKPLIEKLRKNPYYRVMRIDKLTVAVLENIFRIYRDEREAVKKIPTLKYITEDVKSVKKRAETLSHILKGKNILNNIISTKAYIGGGSMPEEEIESFGIEFLLDNISADEIEKRLRTAKTAVIGRIEKNRFILDMKTIDEDDIKETAEIVALSLGE